MGCPIGYYFSFSLMSILILMSNVEVIFSANLLNYVDSSSKHSINFASGSLMLEESCRSELHRICHHLKNDSEDIDVFQCIQINNPSELSLQCQTTIWSRLEQFTSNDNLKHLFQPICQSDLRQIQAKCVEGSKLLACMLDNRDEITSPQCKNLLQLTEWIAFTDFRIISQFTNVCKTFVEKFTCGRVETDKTTRFSQGKTLECLQVHIDKIDGECRSQVLRLSELQSDDIKLDKVLYEACANDRARLCVDVPQMYKCLMDHTSDKLMSEKCREQLLRRQVLIATDYQVSKRLARACKDDIRLHKCRRLVSEDREIRLAQILVCLENAVHNGSRVSGECQLEMSDHRKMLMTDYRLSPEIVTRCSTDIVNYCKGLETGGKTIHCLMEHARHTRKKDRISPPCLRAVESLVKTTDLGEDWRVDPVLKEACQSVVDATCRGIRGGDARVMSCLMDNLESDVMTAPCESALIQIQYFIARDFELDPRLYRACYDEATRLCHAKKEWFKAKDMTPNNAPLVLPCLYRYLYHSGSKLQLGRSCSEEVRRVMRQRAESARLLPEVEQACVDDLGLYCRDRTDPGQEMDCLQEHQEELKPKCALVVSNFTVAQVQDVRLNPLLMKYCGHIMEKFCKAELHSTLKDSSRDMMDCLVQHKNSGDLRDQYKCHQSIEHFQLITARDFRFTVTFKDACKDYAMRYCPQAKTKAQVIECLSSIITNDTISDARFRIKSNCRQQVRNQLLQQRENFNLDPVLKTSCAADVAKFCTGVERGEAQVLECLLEHKAKVSMKCHKALFHVEQQDLGDSSSDYALLNTCKLMIKFYCEQQDAANTLTCLKRFKDTPDFEEKCKLLVIKRMIEQNEDYRFNPTLVRACRPDISKYCVTVVAHQPQDSELEGKVVACLKIKFRERKLRHECENKLTEILKQAALDYRLNPLLKSLCLNEIQGLCEVENREEMDSERGSVEECLKQNLVQGKIRDRACKQEVAALIEEGRADINVDPVLHNACSLDLSKFCADVAPGNGRQLLCLENLMKKNDDPTNSLQEQCRTMLQARMDMFINAEALISAPSSLHDMYGAVQRSPARQYLLGILFSIVGTIFLLGLLVGRVASRNVAAKRK